MILSGFADEVSDDLTLQIKALKTLGWRYIDLRTIGSKNVSSLNDVEFDNAHRLLAENDIEIACFGSTIANWGRDARSALDLDLLEMKNSINHMKKAGVRFIRIMSYQIDSPSRLDSDHEVLVIENLRRIVTLAEENGVVCLHENCETWGGQSCHHSLRLLEKIDSPALKLVFDTGNPVSMHYIAGEPPYAYQDSLKFFREVHDHVAYLHVKDARWIDNRLHYTFPGEGQGHVAAILRMVKQEKMDIPIAIEPHMAVVFHDPAITASAMERWQNFIDYGNQLVRMAEAAGITFS
jgi:sugar phosphate isomerase/epimerase